MKVLSVLVSATTLLFLKGRGIVLEELVETDIETIIVHLQDGLYDACIIDLDKSDLGIYLPREIRESGVKIPLIGLSAGDDGVYWSEYRALFLEQGGDDLLRLPGSPRELVATLRSCTRRATGTQHDVIECKKDGVELKINLTALLVTVNDNAVRLTSKEFLLLSILARSKGRHVSKETLLNRMYVDGVEEVPDLKIVDVFICKLRKKLADTCPGSDHFIATVWGQGYQLVS